MAHVFVERRRLVKGVSVTWDMAHHLYARFSYGQTLIVSEKPYVLMAALRKQWLKVTLKLRNEYSRTVDPARKERIGRLIVHMQNVPFAVGLPGPQPYAGAGIFLIHPDQIPELASIHRTIYAVNLPATREALKEHLTYHGLLVEYES